MCLIAFNSWNVVDWNVVDWNVLDWNVDWNAVVVGRGMQRSVFISLFAHAQ